MTEYEKMISEQMYSPADPKLVALRLRARELMQKINKTGPDEIEQRTAYLKELFGSTGKHIYIEPNFRCDYGCNIHVGENFYANYDCVFLDVAPIHIGSGCMLGPQVGIYTATHPLDPVLRNSGREYGKAIRIGDACWIGGHATINPGVTLGNAVIVASGAVVTKSFGDRLVIGGNPARIIKAID